MLLFLYFLLVGGFVLVAQMSLQVALPGLIPFGIGVGLLPLVVIYSSLEFADERGPILAVLLGFVLDLSSSRVLGTSVFSLAAISLLITTQASKEVAHRWYFYLICSLVGTFVFLALDYMADLLHNLAWREWVWPLSVWNSITYACLFNLVVTPFLFPLLRAFPRWVGLKLASVGAARRYA